LGPTYGIDIKHANLGPITPDKEGTMDPRVTVTGRGILLPAALLALALILAAAATMPPTL